MGDQRGEPVFGECISCTGVRADCIQSTGRWGRWVEACRASAVHGGRVMIAFHPDDFSVIDTKSAIRFVVVWMLCISTLAIVAPGTAHGRDQSTLTIPVAEAREG